LKPPSTLCNSASDTGCMLMFFPFVTKGTAAPPAIGPPSAGEAPHLPLRPARSSAGSRCRRRHARASRMPGACRPAPSAGLGHPPRDADESAYTFSHDCSGPGLCGRAGSGRCQPTKPAATPATRAAATLPVASAVW
jgi:hypothetical protein